MRKDKRFFLFPLYSDKLLILTTLTLVLFGSIMIVSAEMGVSAGDSSIITKTLIKQLIYFVASFIAMAILSKIRVVSFKRGYINSFYVVVLLMLLSTRLFGAVNGAYAWIRIGELGTIQPSEFAKVFIIIFGAKTLGVNCGEKNMENLKRFWTYAGIYFVIIALYQKDLGSALVFLGISFIISLIPPYKEFNNYHLICFLIMVGGIAAAVFILSPLGTSFLEHFSGSYKIARFLASANPFAYQYDSGYHLIMGLVSFATGGFFGLGYGNSIHKYMNFPNPSTDFILPVIVEETGILGFLIILILYGLLIIKLIHYSKKVKLTSSKMILVGTYTYIVIHFVLNVGGVSGLVPLTGVPLLLISYGGSSLLATCGCLGICESEIIKYRKDKDNESSSREI